MVRHFPGYTRRHVPWTVALLSTLVLTSVPGLLSDARADNLHDKKNQAHQGVKAAQADLEESSAALSAAYAKVRSAKYELAAAQSTLAKTQGQLTAARVLDTQMQAKLVEAKAAFETAKQELKDGQAAVVEQRADLGRFAASNYQHGDPRLLGLSAVLNAHDLSDLTTQLNTVDNLLDRQQTMLDKLKAAEALLKVQKAKVEQARGVVAEHRQTAAVNLARTQVLQERAARNRYRVAVLVNESRHAAAAAHAARAADKEKLARSERQEARIQRLILARAARSKGGYKGDSGGFLMRPVPGYVTSPYGYRVHPIYGYYSLHDGTDFHAPCGTPEVAAASGTIISEYYSDVWGNRLYLDVGRVNGHSMTLIYNHISSYRRGQGAHVKRGEVVALSGTTGWSTACHLHFTVMVDGKAVDPEKFF